MPFLLCVGGPGHPESGASRAEQDLATAVLQPRPLALDPVAGPGRKQACPLSGYSPPLPRPSAPLTLLSLSVELSVLDLSCEAEIVHCATAVSARWTRAMMTRSAEHQRGSRCFVFSGCVLLSYACTLLVTANDAVTSVHVQGLARMPAPTSSVFTLESGVAGPGGALSRPTRCLRSSEPLRPLQQRRKLFTSLVFAVFTGSCSSLSLLTKLWLALWA